MILPVHFTTSNNLLSVVNVDRELSTKSVFHPSNVLVAARNYIETILLS